MRRTLSAAALIFQTPLLAEYVADPLLSLEKRLLAATIDEAPFRILSKTDGRPGWPLQILLRSLVLQRRNAWHDRQLVRELQDNNRVRYIVGLPIGTRDAPSRSVIIEFRNAVVEAGLGTELFDQQVRWIARAVDLIDAEQDDFGIDATRGEAAAAQPTVIGLLQHGVRRVLLATRAVAPDLVAGLDEQLHLQNWLGRRFQRCSRGISSRGARRLWRQCYRKAEKVLRGVATVRERNEVVGVAASLLERIMAERGLDGLEKPKDRLTNAMDGEVRFGCKGDAAHRITWHGTKVTIVTHVKTDLIVAMDVMYANQVDGAALTRGLDQATELLGTDRLARLYADSAYTEEALRRDVTARHTVLVGPRRGKRRRGRVRGGGRVVRKADRGVRCHIERVHAHLVRFRGNRRAWYLGLRKTVLQTALSAVAANLVRLQTLFSTGKLQLPGALA